VLLCAAAVLFFLACSLQCAERKKNYCIYIDGIRQNIETNLIPITAMKNYLLPRFLGEKLGEQRENNKYQEQRRQKVENKIINAFKKTI
jgi:hypothetical protein